MEDKITAARAAYNDAVEKRDAAYKTLDELPDDATSEEFDAATAEFDEAQEAVERSKKALERYEGAKEAREKTPAIAVPERDNARPTGTTKAEDIYRPNNENGYSFLRDVWQAQTKGDVEARDRLIRNNLIAAGEFRDVTSADPGAAGFIPPNYMASMWQNLPRVERVLANQLPRFPFPTSGLTLTIPKVQTGVSVASQAGEGANLSETDIDTQSLTVYQETLGGLQDISQQALEFSFPGMDMVILEDLVAAYDAELERQLFHGAGHGSNELEGLLGVTGNNDITWTESTPAGTTGLKKIYECVSEISTDTSGRFRARQVYMHGRRSAWFASQTSTSAPIFQQGGLNQSYAQGTQANGFVGSLAGLDAFASNAILTTRGASTNQDVIFVLDPSPLRLAESTPRVETFRDVLSQSLEVRLRLYAYVYFVSSRLPATIANIEGTGLVTPSFA